MARTTRLTPELIQAIAKRIKAGAYPYIAAQSLGIPKSTFYAWMQKGENGRGLNWELRDKVLAAASAARSDAENRVFKEKPLEWLRLGPGREVPDEPGWTNAPQTVQIEGGKKPVQLLAQSRLVVSPEDHRAALDVLEELGLIQFTERGLLMGVSATIASKSAGSNEIGSGDIATDLETD